MRSILRSLAVLGLSALFLAGWSVGATSVAQAGWAPQTSGSTQALKCVSFVDDTHGWAFGANGTVLTTTDGGQTWVARTSGTTQTLWVGLFVNTLVGFAAGDASAALSTQDGGVNWSVVKAWMLSGADLHGGMVAPDGLHAIGVGSAGVIVATEIGARMGP